MGKKGRRFYSEPFNPLESLPGMGVHTFKPNRRQKLQISVKQIPGQLGQHTPEKSQVLTDTASSTGLHVQAGMYLPRKFGGGEDLD